MKERYIVTQDLLVGPWVRLLHYFIDLIMQYALGVVIGLILGLLSNLTDSPGLVDWLGEMNRFQEYLFGIVLGLVYYGVMEIAFGQTVAKFLTGTIVVDYNGERVDAGTIIKRSFCRIIPFEAFSFIGEGRGWHDTIPDVYVVRKRELAEQKALHYDFESLGNSEENPV